MYFIQFHQTHTKYKEVIECWVVQQLIFHNNL